MMFDKTPAPTVLEAVITVPLRPERDEVSVAQSPEKLAGMASESCGKSSEPQPANIIKLTERAVASLAFAG
jgi:hypothetical protein